MIVNAILTPADIALLPQDDLSETTCIVFDVLRATSSMVTALEYGAAEIVPVRTIEEAWEVKKLRPTALLGGERHGEKIEGFDLGNSPLEYRDLRGNTIISTTTNGTIAVRACEGAQQVLIGAIRNLEALAKELLRAQPPQVALICAGTFTTFALEDAWAAGRLVQLLGKAELTDSAQALLALAKAEPNPLAVLQRARNGKALAAKGRGDEVTWCARESCTTVLPVFNQGVIRLPNPAKLETTV